MSNTAAKTASRSPLPVIAVTSGEPAGIGPDICLRLAERTWPARLLVLGDRQLLAERARLLGVDAAAVEIRDIPLDVPCSCGRLDPGNARHVLRLLDAALAGCRSGEYAAMVTAPVHKGVINDAGIAFSGHTEYLAEHTGTPRVVMMLAGAAIAAALLYHAAVATDEPSLLPRIVAAILAVAGCAIGGIVVVAGAYLLAGFWAIGRLSRRDRERLVHEFELEFAKARQDAQRAEQAARQENKRAAGRAVAARQLQTLTQLHAGSALEDRR